jgi:alpha-1,2-glucosyltransferase
MTPVHHMQTQRYCAGDFLSWDAKITTLPGLYYVSLALLPALSALDCCFGALLRWLSLAPTPLSAAPGAIVYGGGWVGCSARELRLLNSVLAVATAGVLLRILVHVHGLHSSREGWRHRLRVAVVLLMPVQYFFYFVFYTDAVGTLMVLAMYERCLASYGPWWASWKQARVSLMAAICGAAAVFCRQTNVVWVVFCGGTLALGRIERDARLHSESSFAAHASQAIRQLFSRQLVPIIVEPAPLILVVVGFGRFVHINGGVAVGDKNNHQVGFHPMQPCYWQLLLLGFMWPWLVSPMRVLAFLQWLRCRPCASLACLLCVLAGAHSFTYAHPFLLADNRHYTFYLWKNVFQRVPLARYALAPVYLFSGWSCWLSLRRTCSPLWVAWFLLCACLVVMPTGLLEFRYFIVQTVLLLLHQPLAPLAPPDLKAASRPPATPGKTPDDANRRGKEAREDEVPWRGNGDSLALLQYAVINVATIYMFLFRSFAWPDGSVARFMW